MTQHMVEALRALERLHDLLVRRYPSDHELWGPLVQNVERSIKDALDEPHTVTQRVGVNHPGGQVVGVVHGGMHQHNEHVSGDAVVNVAWRQPEH